MPSNARNLWDGDRKTRLDKVDASCAAAHALTPPDPALADELLRGYVTLLSAHLQGFCRDLYTECSSFVRSKIRASLQTILGYQFMEGLKLDHGNPNFGNIVADFRRFDVGVKAEADKDPTSKMWLPHLDQLNKWRNVVAHHGSPPSGLPPLALPLVQGWRPSCDRIVEFLDGMMYNHLRRLMRRKPW